MPQEWEFFERRVQEEAKEIRRTGHKVFSADQEQQRDALVQIFLIREAILSLLSDIGTRKTRDIHTQCRYRDSVYLQRMVYNHMSAGDTRATADALSRYTSFLPFLFQAVRGDATEPVQDTTSAAVNENATEPPVAPMRVRNFTSDAVRQVLADDEKHPNQVRKDLYDIQIEIYELIKTLQKPIKGKKKRSKAVIDLMHLRGVLDDICTMMFLRWYFAETSPRADIYTCIREAREDFDVLGDIVLDIMYDGVSVNARMAAKKLHKWAWVMQAYIPEK